MSFSATFEIDKLSLDVLDCEFGVERSVDSRGYPTTEPMGVGIIKIVVASENDTLLFDWSTNKTVKNGTIVFDGKYKYGSRMRKIEFKDAYCIGYREIFSSLATEPMRIELTISAREMTMEQVTYTNDWPGV